MKCFVTMVVLNIYFMAVLGCGPSVEERKVIAVLNDLDEVIAKGGYIKKLEKFEKRPNKVFIVEAEIVDKNDVPLGRLRSERVEGFLTTKPRIQWYETPGVREEWKEPPRRRGPRRNTQEGEQSERRRPVEQSNTI